MSSVSYSFVINGKIRGIVKPTCEIRRGDPISPYLFSLCADVFSCLLSKTVRERKIHGVKVYRGTPKIFHLLFADGNVQFMRANKEECQALMEII